MCAIALLSTTSNAVYSADSLDALFSQKTGRNSTNRTSKAVAPHAIPRQNANNLDALLNQEKAQEVRQRQLAEEKRRAEEIRQRQIAEEQRRQAEIQRQLAAEQEQQQQRRAERQQQETRDVGFLGAALGLATGNRNMAGAYLEQGISGQDNSAAVNAAMQQDVNEYRQAQEEARRRQAEAQRQQAEANRRMAAYNQQQQAGGRPCNAPAGVQCAADANYQQQQDQQQAHQEAQRQQQEARRAQDEAREQQRQQMERQRLAQPVNECVSTVNRNGSSYLYNRCTFRIALWWRGESEQSGNSWGIDPGAYTSAGGGVRGRFVFMACKEPAVASESGCRP